MKVIFNVGWEREVALCIFYAKLKEATFVFIFHQYQAHDYTAHALHWTQKSVKQLLGLINSFLPLITKKKRTQMAILEIKVLLLLTKAIKKSLDLN